MKVAAIEVENLTKVFPRTWKTPELRAVESLSFRVEAGKVLGLIGANGSGKSTTLKTILGLVQPSSGVCRVFGERSGSHAARSAIGYLPEAPQFHGFLTARELVRFYGGICGLHGTQREKRTNEVLDWVGLTYAADRRVANFSKGMLQRVGLAQALVHDPKILILDEPTAGLDPIGCVEMDALIRSLKTSGKTVVICSHQLDQLEVLCDELLLIYRGRSLAFGETATLLRDVSPQQSRSRLEAFFIDQIRADDARRRTP